MGDCEKLFSSPTFTDHITLHLLNHKNDWFSLNLFSFFKFGQCLLVYHSPCLIPKCSKFLKILVFLACFSKLFNLGTRKKVHFHTLLQHKQQTWCTPSSFLRIISTQGNFNAQDSWILWHLVRSFILLLHFTLFISRGFNKHVI